MAEPSSVVSPGTLDSIAARGDFGPDIVREQAAFIPPLQGVVVKVGLNLSGASQGEVQASYFQNRSLRQYGFGLGLNVRERLLGPLLINNGGLVKLDLADSPADHNAFSANLIANTGIGIPLGGGFYFDLMASQSALISTSANHSDSYLMTVGVGLTWFPHDPLWIGVQLKECETAIYVAEGAKATFLSNLPSASDPEKFAELVGEKKQLAGLVSKVAPGNDIKVLTLSTDNSVVGLSGTTATTAPDLARLKATFPAAASFIDKANRIAGGKVPILIGKILLEAVARYSSIQEEIGDPQAKMTQLDLGIERARTAYSELKQSTNSDRVYPRLLIMVATRAASFRLSEKAQVVASLAPSDKILLLDAVDVVANGVIPGAVYRQVLSGIGDKEKYEGARWGIIAGGAVLGGVIMAGGWHTNSTAVWNGGSFLMTQNLGALPYAWQGGGHELSTREALERVVFATGTTILASLAGVLIAGSSKNGALSTERDLGRLGEGLLGQGLAVGISFSATDPAIKQLVPFMSKLIE